MAEVSGLFGEGGLGVNFSSIISGLGTLATGIAIFVIVAIITAIITYFIVRKKAYNKTIEIFEEVNQVAVPTYTDVAREIALPNTSVRAYLLRDKKIYLPRPTIQTGKNKFWFFIRSDGEWINIGLENINKTMTQLNVRFDHSDMRLSNASIKRLVTDNYKKINWIKEYAPYIAIGILIIMLGITFFLLLNKASAVASQFSGVAGQLGSTISELNKILESLDNIKSGSGVKIVT